MKIFFIYMFLFFLKAFCCFSQPSFSGSGTDIDPYQIWNGTHFKELAESTYTLSSADWTRNKHFKLINDIDLGDSIFGLGYWRGHFHGNGKTITRNYESVICSELGYYLDGVTATIDSLIADGYAYTDHIYIAGIVCIIRYGSIISNCVNNATIICTDDGSKYGMFEKGAIVAKNEGTIINCINNGDITGVDRIGGIAGDNDGGQIINCINTGKITATASGDNSIFSGVGGICGTIANSSYYGISNCVNTGTVVGQGFVGGIIGLANGKPMSPSPITNCVNYGYIKGTSAVGGIAGIMWGGIYANVNISNCVNAGVVEGSSDVGSIVGKE